jgi:enoyl-CoA hydratase
VTTFTHLRVSSAKDGIVVATLDRPERLNALVPAMFDDFIALQEAVDEDPGARVLVLRGSGRGFCAGLDLDEAERLPALPLAEKLALQEHWAASIIGFRRMATPVIAAIHGAAAGAGMGLALAADIRVASESAKFNAAFVRIGLSGGDVGGSWALPRLVGLGRATEILLTGRFVEAQEALDIGLVTALVPEDELLETALTSARMIVSNSPIGMRLSKRVINQNVDATSLESAVVVENRNQVMCMCTDDMVEALHAFREKRAPAFHGR